MVFNRSRILMLLLAALLLVAPSAIGQQQVAPSTLGVAAARLALVKVKSAASTNSTLVKAGATVLYGYNLTNSTAATVQFIKLYNKATAPTCGTDTPAFTLTVPANSSTVWSTDIGLYFPLGLGYCITAGVAESDSAIAAADGVVGHIDTN